LELSSLPHRGFAHCEASTSKSSQDVSLSGVPTQSAVQLGVAEDEDCLLPTLVLFTRIKTTLLERANVLRFSIAKAVGSIMDSSCPRVGDLLVVRLSADAAGILIVTAGAGHRLHSPCNTEEEAVHRAEQMAATLLVDVWRRTSPTTFELIVSYRRDAGSQASH
jgi:hypothetical protein